MNENTFKVIENDNEVEYIVVKFCHNLDNNKKYVIYRKEDDDKLYASLIYIDNGEIVLGEIEDDKEWDFLDKELSKNE